jgi:RND family efflux transporter MFP subunit
MGKRFLLWSGAVVAIIGISAFFVISRTGESFEYESTAVEKGAVRHVVSVTGTAEPLERIVLSFSTGGTLQGLAVSEGVRVGPGQEVARLDTGLYESGVAEARARLAVEQAVLGDVLAPLRMEERALKDTLVTNAEETLSRASDSANAAISRAFTVADDAIHEKVDKLFGGQGRTSPTFGIRFTAGVTEYLLRAGFPNDLNLNDGRSEVTEVLQRMRERIHSTKDPITLLEETNNDLITIESFLTDVAQAVNRYIPEDRDAQAVYQLFQSTVSLARTAISGARADVLNVYGQYQAAQAGLVVALRDYTLADAGPSMYRVAAQQASVIAAEQGVGGALERMQQAILRSPVAGTVARIEKSVGESVGPYEPTVLLMSDGSYEVQAYIPEVDIAKIQLGNKARITFDAFERTSVFSGTVVRIALVETMREGVPTYKTTIVLDDELPERYTIRPGMTADIDITTNEQEGVLFVPTRSVIRDGDRTYVRVVEQGEIRERDVVTGLRGSAGTVEIVSGLSLGEEVVLFVRDL